jgi:preprotein translocase subunit Sec61beta
MAKQEKGAGFQQAAGLIRYFDAEEETAIKFDPRAVLIATFMLSIVVLIFQMLPETRLS